MCTKHKTVVEVRIYNFGLACRKVQYCVNVLGKVRIQSAANVENTLVIMWCHHLFEFKTAQILLGRLLKILDL